MCPTCEWEPEPVEDKARESEDSRGLSLRLAVGVSNIGETATVAAMAVAAMGASIWHLDIYNLFTQFGFFFSFSNFSLCFLLAAANGRNSRRSYGEPRSSDF